MPRTSIQTQEKQGSADYEERKPGKNFRLALPAVRRGAVTTAVVEELRRLPNSAAVLGRRGTPEPTAVTNPLQLHPDTGTFWGTYRPAAPGLSI